MNDDRWEPALVEQNGNALQSWNVVSGVNSYESLIDVEHMFRNDNPQYLLTGSYILRIDKCTKYLGHHSLSDGTKIFWRRYLER